MGSDLSLIISAFDHQVPAACLPYAELVLAYVQGEKIMGDADDARHQLRILRLAQKGKSAVPVGEGKASGATSGRERGGGA